MGVTQEPTQEEIKKMTERGLTSYVVLVHDPGEHEDGIWAEAYSETVEATHAEAAIKQAAGDGGVYVAVPARSWKPMRVQQKQTTVTVVEPVDS